MANNFHKRVGNYIFLGPIGRGAFAEVYKGVHQTTHEEVAIKMMSRARVRDEEAQIEKEIRILRELDHFNIVRFLDYQKTQNHYYLVFEFCKHGDLDHFIKEFYGGKVPEYEAQKFIQQIIEGIKAMKAKNIVHRDLKLANILVSKDFILKIADFGLARYLEKDDLLLKTMVGTPLNMDPSILERRGYSEKCDIWSLGVIFYQILVGKAPYNPGRGAGIEDLLMLIKKQPLIFPPDVPLSDAVKQLIKSMLVYDVNKRISFDDLFNHDWVTGKYVIEDPNKVQSLNDLSATQLLQSVYDKRKTTIKKQKPLNKPDEKQKLNLDEKPIKPAKNSNQVEELNLANVTNIEKERELYGAAFLAKVYEIFRNKVYKLREYVVKVKNMNIRSDLFDDDRVSIIQILLSMDLLKILSDILNARFGIVNEAKEEVIFSNDFKAFWDKIMANKTSIENFLCTDDAALEITNLYDEVKSNYIEVFEMINIKLEGLRDTFERFKGFNVEKLIMDCLIQLSENSAYQEYLEENLDSKIEKYNTCGQICEFLLFRNSFRFTHFKIVEKNQENSEERKEDKGEEPFKVISDAFQNGLNFTLLEQMIHKQEFKARFASIKNNFCISDSELREPSELDHALKKFQVLINKRISDLKEKNEEKNDSDFSL